LPQERAGVSVPGESFGKAHAQEEPEDLWDLGDLGNRSLMCHTLNVNFLRYIELKSGYSDDGPAWIGYVQESKSGRTLYFNGRGLMKLKGQRRGDSGGNYVDMENGESFWVSGVKKDGQDRHLGRIRQSSG
jgi:hypothetical protein